MAETRSLPAWLRQETLPDMPLVAKKRSSRRGFIEKTVSTIAEFMQNEVFSEHLASQPGVLQGLDPRVKLLTILALIGVAGLFHHVIPLLLFNAWLLWLARMSLVPMGTFLKRVWIVVPLFTGILVFPALFNVVRPGTTLFVVLHLNHPVHLAYWTIPAEVTITKEGVVAAALLMLRVGASVSLAVLLTLTTRWNVLLKALKVLRIPDVFIAVLDMSYRYIFLLLQTSSDMFIARKSRLLGQAKSREERRFVASAMGNLWGKTAALSEEVHGAMLARGYMGEPKSLFRFKMQQSDWLWIVLVFIVMVLFMGGDLVFG